MNTHDPLGMTWIETPTSPATQKPLNSQQPSPAPLTGSSAPAAGELLSQPFEYQKQTTSNSLTPTYTPPPSPELAIFRSDDLTIIEAFEPLLHTHGEQPQMLVLDRFSCLPAAIYADPLEKS